MTVYETALEGNRWTVRREGRAVFMSKSLAPSLVEMRNRARGEADAERKPVRTVYRPPAGAAPVESLFTPEKATVDG